ncbi:MAG TPA: hypothetical protein VIE65_15520 [Methylobacter sp.]|jgi:hypothetical protein
MAETKKTEKIALIDLDGTLADYDAAMRRDMQTIAAPGEEIKWYDGAPEHMKARKKLIQDQPDWWYNLEPLPLGMQVFEMMGDIGFTRMILTKGPTKRNPNAWTEKVRWCKRHIPGTDVTITADKGLVYGKVLMDDFPEYVDRWLEWRHRGLVLMPACAWNEGYSHPNVLRFNWDNLREVRERLTTAYLM